MGEGKYCQYKRVDEERCFHPYFATWKNPETGEEKDYCIFHAPMETKERYIDKFWKEFEKYFEQTKEKCEITKEEEQENIWLDCEGFIFPDTGKILIKREFPFDVYFIRTKFTGNANFLKAQFSGFADFQDARFSRDANFIKAQFSSDTDFSGVKFSADTDFWGAQFSGNVIFKNVQFSGGTEFWSVQFSANADFRDTQFSNVVTFWDAHISGVAFFENVTFSSVAEFWSVRFLGDARFGNAKFSNDVYFPRAQFSRDAVFDNVDFCSRVYFQNVQFAGNASFWHTRFSTTAYFKEARFSGEAYFSDAQFFDEAIFLDAKFSDTADFSRAKFSGKTDFKNTRFEFVPLFESTFFERPPDFRKIEFAGDFFFGLKVTDKDVFLYCTFSDNESFWEAFETYFNATKKEFEIGDEYRRENVILDCKRFVIPEADEHFKRVFPFPVDFSGAYFNGNSDFGDATFNDDADFSGAIANGEINFLEAEFQSSADFRGLEVEELAYVLLNFTFFQQPTRVFIGDGDLSRWSFTGTNIEEVNFFRPKWPVRKGRGKRKKVYDEDLAEEPRSNVNWEEAGEVYRRLRLNYESKLAYRDAGDFHYGQLECRRKNKDKKGFFAWCDRRLIGAYKFFCGYGESIARPLFLLWFFFAAYTAAAMFIGFNTSTAEHVRWVLVPLNQMFAGGFCNWVAKFAYSIIFTVKSAVTFSLPPGNNEILVGLAYVWKFIAVILVTFLILALRRRFKR
jgi:hypothetical protein